MRSVIIFITILAFPATVLAQSIPIGGSMITNGGFESGYTNWTVDKANTTINTTSPLFGARSLRLGAAPGGRAQLITTGIEAGARYRVSAYGRVAAASDVATVGVEFFNSANRK